MKYRFMRMFTQVHRGKILYETFQNQRGDNERSLDTPAGNETDEKPFTNISS